MQEHNGKMNPTDADTLSELLEIQLEEKRSEWQRATSRYRTFRSFGFAFMALIVIGALFAFFFAFSRLNEERPVHRPSTASKTSKP